MATEQGEAAVDRLVARLCAATPFRFTVPLSDAEKNVAFRLRYETVVSLGWVDSTELADGLERDAYDDHAVQVIGWIDDVPVSAGRIVLPPGPLPTEEACGIVVEPAGHVVDVGRMLVVPSWQDRRHQALLALLARLYLEVRARGFTVAAGMMTTAVHAIARQLGLHLEVLGPAQDYWHGRRRPIRFDLAANVTPMTERWRTTD